MTHALVDDWYNHAMSLFAFALGYSYAKAAGARASAVRLRWGALALWLAAYAVYVTYVWSYRAEAVVPSDALRRLMRVVFAVQQWSAVVAVLGFGAEHLSRGGPVLRYLTIGVFPFYLVHQTIIVVAGHHLARAGLPLPLEAALLLGATLGGCLATYELARRMGPFGVWLGVKSQPRRLVRPAPA